jgi:hypothetical protein
MRWDCTRESRYLLLPEASAGTKQPCGGLGFHRGRESLPWRYPICGRLVSMKLSVGVQREREFSIGLGVFRGGRNAPLNDDATARRCDGVNGVRYPDSPLGRSRQCPEGCNGRAVSVSLAKIALYGKHEMFGSTRTSCETPKSKFSLSLTFR